MLGIELFDSLQDYLRAGGWVMPPLALFAVVLWYAIGYRYSLLRRGSPKSVRVLINRYRRGAGKPPSGVIDRAIVRGLELRDQASPVSLRRRLDDAFKDSYIDIKRYSTTITTLTAAAPLLGLLGTVIGMIETFDSLGDMSLFSQSGGIAGGISTALFTTQMGLVVAIPGLIVKGLLNRRQQAMEVDLAMIKDILTSDLQPQEDAS